MPQRHADAEDETASGGHVPLSGGDLSDDAWEFYWTCVERTLEDVFGTNQNARKAFDRLKSRVEDSEDLWFRASVYHLNAFQVAADLAGVREVTHGHMEKYGEVLRGMATERRNVGYLPAFLRELTP